MYVIYYKYKHDLKELPFEILAEARYTKPLNQVSLDNKTHLIHALNGSFWPADC